MLGHRLKIEKILPTREFLFGVQLRLVSSQSLWMVISSDLFWVLLSHPGPLPLTGWSFSQPRWFCVFRVRLIFLSVEVIEEELWSFLGSNLDLSAYYLFDSGPLTKPEILLCKVERVTQISWRLKDTVNVKITKPNPALHHHHLEALGTSQFMFSNNPVCQHSRLWGLGAPGKLKEQRYMWSALGNSSSCPC